MTVGELIKVLKKFPKDLPVAYSRYSEQVLMEPDEITVETFCKPRPDGWIQNKRPDKETQDYLLFPGN